MKRLAFTISFAIAAVVVVGLLIGNWFSGAGAQEAAGGSAIKGLTGCSTSSIPANDDGSSPSVPLPFTMDFFGAEYNALFVNNNGNVTFDAGLATYTPFGLLGTEEVIIAPFFADVDTRGVGSGLTTYGATTFSGRPAFCVNWINVGYYASNVEKLNSFQLLLVGRSDIGTGDFDIIFNYNQVQWETGDVSGGTDGLGGNSARAGYSNGDDVAFELPGSAVNGALLDSAPTGLINNSRNSFSAGRYVFEVRNGQAPLGGSISGKITGSLGGGNVPLGGSLVQACSTIEPVLPCDVTTTNSSGDYLFTGLRGNGNYFITAYPPRDAVNLGPRTIGAIFLEVDEALTDQDIKLLTSRPVPPDVTIETPFRAGDGTPAVSSTTGATFRQVGACTGGSGSWALRQGGQTLASGLMSETAPGKYKGTIPPIPGRNGRAEMEITIICPGGADKNDIFDIYIDPSGVVSTVQGDPIEGATVTLYRSDSSSGPFDIVPDGSAIMSPSNRTNPDGTDADGVFRWDVIAGYYKVRAEKAGCHQPGNAGQPFVETDVLTIPPPALDLDIRLECPGGVPTATSTSPGQQPTATRTRTPTRTPTAPAGLNGDVNCDGRVDSIDAALVLQYNAGFLATLPCIANADVNDDGRVDSIDAALILQHSAGLLPNL